MFFHFLILFLAVSRLTRMIVFDNGPMSIFKKIRVWCGAEDSFVPSGSLAELLNCPWCVSLWVSIPLFTCYTFYPWQTIAISAPFAMSFVAGFLVIYTSR